jgi:hypothetical protein
MTDNFFLPGWPLCVRQLMPIFIKNNLKSLKPCQSNGKWNFNILFSIIYNYRLYIP